MVEVPPPPQTAMEAINEAIAGCHREIARLTALRNNAPIVVLCMPVNVLREVAYPESASPF